MNDWMTNAPMYPTCAGASSARLSSTSAAGSSPESQAAGGWTASGAPMASAELADDGPETESRVSGEIASGLPTPVETPSASSTPTAGSENGIIAVLSANSAANSSTGGLTVLACEACGAPTT